MQQLHFPSVFYSLQCLMRRPRCGSSSITINFREKRCRAPLDSISSISEQTHLIAVEGKQKARIRREQLKERTTETHREAEHKKKNHPEIDKARGIWVDGKVQDEKFIEIMFVGALLVSLFRWPAFSR